MNVTADVQRGIDLLNNTLEHDWPAEIETDRLDMSDQYACVLGQIFDGFLAGCAELFADPLGAEEETIHAATEHGFYGRQGQWHALADEWRRRLKEMQ